VVKGMWNRTLFPETLREDDDDSLEEEQKISLTEKVKNYLIITNLYIFYP
jgi:hypothetical protein